jgi:hypothetical protein
MRMLVVVAVLVASSSAFAEEPRTVRGETIIIEDKVPGTMAQPVKDPRITAKYSDAAIEQDAWTRAWLLIEIDDRGVVQRLKFLKRPGYDLDQIAIDKMFATKFEPARDGTGRPRASALIYPLEWPSYWWLVTHQGTTTRISTAYHHLPCKGSGRPLNLDRAHPVYRDCAMPDLTQAKRERWIVRPTR